MGDLVMSGASVSVDMLGGRKSRGVAELPDGTKVPSGRAVCKPGGGRHFVSLEHTSLGVDDACAARAKAKGEPVPMSPVQAYQKSLRIRESKRLAAERASEGVPEGSAAPAPGAPPLTGLAAQLAGFDGDEEMQLLIIQKWNAKHAPKAEAAPAPVAAVSAVAPVLPTDDVDAPDVAEPTAADLFPPVEATAKGPVGKRGKVDLAKETGLPTA